MNTKFIEEKTNQAQELITLTKSKELSQEILEKVRIYVPCSRKEVVQKWKN